MIVLEMRNRSRTQRPDAGDGISNSARAIVLGRHEADCAIVGNESVRFFLGRHLLSGRVSRWLGPAGAPIGEVFSFLSGLYSRGMIAYVERFADPPRGAAAALVITTDRGLVATTQHVTRDDLVAFGAVDIGAGDQRYRGPLERAAMQ